MPDGFPLNVSENAGNLVHWHAPLWMFPHHIHQSQDWSSYGATNFASLVNAHCSHLILTLADTLKANDPDDERYLRAARFIDKFERPLVIFGLGIGNLPLGDSGHVRLTAAQSRLIETMAQHTPVIGVRGKTTAEIIRRSLPHIRLAPVGCPSIFARPQHVRRAACRKIDVANGRAAFAGTVFHSEPERTLFLDAVTADNYLIEPVNRHHHLAAVRAMWKPTLAREDLPYFLRDIPFTGDQLDQLSEFYRRRYRLFRNIDEWITFNERNVSFTYGSRFHVNMASLISGVPALWIIHDARTAELADILHLPAIHREEAAGLTASELAARADYEMFLDHYDGALNRFLDYLECAGLPRRAPNQ